MENTTVNKLSILPTLLLSVFLLFVTAGVARVEASPVVAPVNLPSNAVQLAWWVGGPGWGYYNRGYGGYYRGGPVCAERCWRNRWGNLRCGVRCYDY